MAHSLKPGHIAFVPGMRQDLTEESAPPGALSAAVNVRYGKRGGIAMRPGADPVSSATHGASHEIQNSGLSFAGSVGEAALLGTVEGKAFAQDSDGPLMNYAGKFSTCLPLKKRSTLITEATGTVGGERYGIASSASGYVCVAACDSTDDLVISIESDNGTRIFDSIGPQSATKCSVFADGDTFYVVSQSNQFLSVDSFAIANGVVTQSSAAVATLNSGSQYWDVAPAGGGAGWVLIYQSGGAQLTISLFVGLAWDSNLATITVLGNCPCSIFVDTVNLRIWAGWWNSPGVGNQLRVRAWTTAGVALCAETTLVTAASLAAPLVGTAGELGDAFFTYNRSALPATVYGYLTLPANPANACTFVTSTAFYVMAVSKPDAMQRSWVLTAVDTPPGFQAGDFVTQRALLLRWTQPEDSDAGTTTIELSLASYDDDWVSTTRPARDMFAAATNIDGVYTFALPRQLRTVGAIASGARLWGIEIVQYESIEAHPHRSTVRFGNSALVAGQPVQLFGRSRGIADGAGLDPSQGSAEIGFPVAPQITGVTQGSTGGFAAGTYSYVAVFEWIGPDGTRHRSPPSAPQEVVVTGASDDAITLSLSCPNYGQRWDATSGSYPMIHVYRTEANGSIHYRVTPGSGGPVAIDLTDGQVDFADEVYSDDDLLKIGDALYVDAALVDFNLAPSCRFMWRDERRIYSGGLWDDDQVHAMLDPAHGQPIESSDFEGGNGPTYRILIGETTTGGEYQDGINYVFARRAIYAFSGDGPDRQGNGDFGRPRIITRETGCKDYRSVKATSAGIFFQSERGIELIPRGGGNPIFIGAGIQDLTSVYSEVLGAAIHSDRSTRTVRFALRRPDTDGTIVAEYDLDIGAWGYSTYYANLSVIGEWPSGTFLGFEDQTETVCGLLETNNSTAYEDSGSSIAAVLETHVIRPWGFAGYGRINSATVFLSKTNEGDDLTIQARVDGVLKERPPIGAPWDLPATSRSIYRELTVCKECTAFELSVSLTRVGSLRVPVMHGFTFESQALDGARRLPGSEQ